MANYIFSYDLNGLRPTHAVMDQHIRDSGWANGRILETVWYIGTDENEQEVADYLKQILSNNDSYMLVTASMLTFENLLVSSASLLEEWEANA